MRRTSMQTTTQIRETVKILYSGKSYPRGNSWRRIRADKEQLAKNAKREHKHNRKPSQKREKHNTTTTITATTITTTKNSSRHHISGALSLPSHCVAALGRRRCQHHQLVEVKQVKRLSLVSGRTANEEFRSCPKPFLCLYPSPWSPVCVGRPGRTHGSGRKSLEGGTVRAWTG
jgi:hypothetical protein